MKRYRNTHSPLVAIALGIALVTQVHAQTSNSTEPQAERHSAQTAEKWLEDARNALLAGDKPLARNFIERALALEPTLGSARIELLWLDIGSNNKTPLQRNLSRWEPEAMAGPAYWAAYALGHLKTEQFDTALVWYSKQVEIQPSDIVWQLSFAYELAQAGGADQAQTLRMEIVERMRTYADAIERLPQADRKVIMQTHAYLEREFKRPDASERVLLRMLELGYRDAQVYESLVSATLAQRKYDVAQAWINRAHTDGQFIPAYLELGVAIGLQQNSAIRAVLEAREQELSANDKIYALRLIGDRNAALKITVEALADSKGVTREALLRQEESLIYELAPRLEASYETKNLGYLDIQRNTAQLELPQRWGVLTFMGSNNRLRADISTAFYKVASSERDLAVIAKFGSPAVPILVTLGSNWRPDKSLVYGRLQWNMVATPWLSARFDLQVNNLTEDTSALRALGAKDRAAVSLNVRLDAATYGRLEIASQRFHTRWGDSLGKGGRTEFELGTSIHEKWPNWQIRLAGSAERNQLTSALPASLVGSALSPAISQDTLVARRFSTLGVGTTWRWGNSDPPQHKAHGFLDAWLGRQWPASERAYSVRAFFSMPLARRSMLEFEGSYSTVVSDFPGRPYQSLRVLYRHLF